MNIKAINTDIIFSFIQDVKNGAFVTKTDWGLEITKPEADMKEARWGKILAKGEGVENTDIKIGEYILIEPLMWTNKIVYENTNLWKTNESKILATSKKEPENII